MNFQRIATIASNVFLEVVRDRILYIIGVFALLVMASVRLLPEVSAGLEHKIVLDFGMALIDFLSLLITVFVSANLVNKEIEKRTVYLLVSKPVSRTELIIGKHFGISAFIAVLVLAMALLYFGILSFNQIVYPFNSLLITILFLWLQLSLIAAVGILLGVFTSSLLASLLTFGVYIMGSLSRDLLALGKLSENPALEQIMRSIYIILPDLARLNLKNEAVYGYLPDPSLLITNAIYAILYITLLLSLSIVIFWKREF
ncbi:MAG: ABC transporter permease [Planktothrix sp.]|uniref:ABC transporter permease n=1 Tax=Planktothrix sp. TaxID=3088171 RepID=UPI0038D4F98C